MDEEMIKTLKEEQKHRTQHPYWIWETLQSIPQMLSLCLEDPVTGQIDSVVAQCVRRKVNKIVLLGRGSSYFAALAVKFFLEKQTRLPVSCQVTNVFGSYPGETVDAQSVIFFLSHSGKSEGDLPVVASVREKGAYTVGVTDVPESTLGQAVDDLIVGPGGTKVELPATRTFSTAIFRMLQFSLALAKALGTAQDGQAYAASLEKLPGQTRAFMDMFEGKAPEVVEQIKDCRSLVVVGYGPNYPIAEESSMALNQSSGIPSQSYELENYIHGAIQALTKEMAVIAIAPPGELQERMLRLVMAARVIGAKTVLLAPNSPRLPEADAWIEMPQDLPELLTPVLYMVPLWQIGYYFGLLGNGGHPDRLSMDKPEFKEGLSYLMKKDKWVTK